MRVEANPEQIQKHLDNLWLHAGKAHGGDAGGVLRACAMTLIVVTEDDRDDPGGTVAALKQEHPSRAIILRLQDRSTEMLEASVNALCTVASGHSESICCELIEISASTLSLSGVSPLLRSLIAPDLPVAIWFHQPCLLDHHDLEPAFGLADKIIIDSAHANGIEGQLRLIQLAGSHRRVAADLAWTRLTPWREEIAHSVREIPSPFHCKAVTVFCTGSAPGISDYYMAAWASNCAGPGCFIDFQYQAAERSIRLDGRSFPEVASSRPDHVLLSEELSIPGRDPVYEATLFAARAVYEARKDPHPWR